MFVRSEWVTFLKIGFIHLTGDKKKFICNNKNFTNYY